MIFDVMMAMQSIAFLLAGLAVSTGGAIIVYIRKSKNKKWHHATGKVVGTNVSKNSNSTTMYRPVVEFITHEDQPIKFSTSYSSSGKPPLGKQMKVIYNPNNHQDARAGSFIGENFGYFFFLFGIPFIAIGGSQFQASLTYFIILAGILLAIGSKALILIDKSLSKLKKEGVNTSSFSTIMEHLENISQVKKLSPHQKEGETYVPVEEFKSSTLNTTNNRNISPLFSAISILVGLSMTVGGVYLGNKEYKFQQIAITTQGKVIDNILRESSSTDSSGHSRTSYTYHPKVNFQVNSKLFIFEDNQGTKPARYSVGQHVPVQYDPTDPNEAHIDEGFMNYMGPFILFIMGLIFSIIALTSYRYTKK